MRQYFYLLMENYDESSYPLKIFLQKHEAIQWGRRLATKLLKEGNCCREIVLYKQEITHSGQLEYVITLKPYQDGADVDIDKYRV